MNVESHFVFPDIPLFDKPEAADKPLLDSLAHLVLQSVSAAVCMGSIALEIGRRLVGPHDTHAQEPARDIVERGESEFDLID